MNMGLLLCFWCLTFVASLGVAEKPNFLFIMIDDLRPELGCYGIDAVRSPHIDRLAKEGVQFNRAYCQVPVCGASRASLLSGLRPTQKRFVAYNSRADKDAPKVETLPAFLKKEGYRTLSNGKVFHHRKDSDSRAWSESAWMPEGFDPKQYLDPESSNYIGGTRNRGPFFEHANVDDLAYFDGQIAQKSVEDLERLKRGKQPFFLAVGFVKPHLPFSMPTRYWELYEGDAVELAAYRSRPVGAPKVLSASAEIKTYSDRGLTYNSEDFHRAARRGYYACISYVDTLVGKLLQALERNDLADNTIVVLMGDHGFHLGEHNFWTKHNTLHNALWTPLIIKAPGCSAGVSDGIVELIDVYPTLCELAGLELPDYLAGESLVRLLEEPSGEGKAYAFARYRNGEAVIGQKYIYTQYSGDVEQAMLFDLESDPNETQNLSGMPEYRNVEVQLQQALR